jgi:hypothetical protein
VFSNVFIGVLSGGSYFELHTGELGGFGEQVSKATISTFMERFGVDRKDVESLLIKYII